MRNKIYLQASDFKISKEPDKDGLYDVLNYTQNDDCPLARAIKRQLNVKNISVDGARNYKGFVSVNSTPQWRFIGWDAGVAYNVATCMKQGDETQYYVVIEEI